MGLEANLRELDRVLTYPRNVPVILPNGVAVVDRYNRAVRGLGGRVSIYNQTIPETTPATYQLKVANLNPYIESSVV